MSDIDKLSTTHVSFDLNKFVTEKKKKISYLYRLPNDDTRCYRFLAYSQTHAFTSVSCRTCNNSLNWKKENGCNQVTITRKTDAYSMATDPQLDHLPCCKPEIYDEVIKDYNLLNENDTIQGIYEFPLGRMRQKGEYKVLHPLRTDPTLCYRFRYERRTKNPFLTMVCVLCASISRKKEMPKPTYRINRRGFMDDPELGHFPECQLFSVEEELQEHHYVNEQTAMQFIYGKDAKVLEEENDDEDEGKVWPIEMMEAKSVAFFYQIPNKQRFYQFMPHNNTDYNALYCYVCQKSNKPSIKPFEWKSDGFSLENSPIVGHLPKCEPTYDGSVLTKKTAKYEDFSQDPNQKYKYPLIKRQMPASYTIIFKIDSNKCYRFHIDYYGARRLYARIECTTCLNLYQINKEKKESGVSRTTYRCGYEGMMDNPLKGHLPGCKPLEYNELNRKYVAMDEERSKTFFHTESAMLNMCNHTKRKKKTTHIDLDDGAQHEKQKMASTALSGIPLKIEIEDSKRAIKHRIHECGDQNYEVIADRRDIVQDKPTKTVRPNRGSIKIEDDAEEIRVENSVKLENDLIGSTSGKRLVIKRKKIYSKVLDIPFFTADEVSVEIIERKVIVDCNREVSALGVAGCSLQYSLELPPSVDVSSVRTKWTGQEIEIVADRNI